MERLCVKYCCENNNSETSPCDFSFNALVVFPLSNIIPKRHREMAMFILDKKKSEEKLKKVYAKIRNSETKLAKYHEIISKLEDARKIADEVGINNIDAFLLLDVGFFCPKCNTFCLQIAFCMTWKNENGQPKMFKFNHKCPNCNSELIMLNGSTKQLEKLKCPKCNGKIHIDENNTISVCTHI